MTFKTDLPPAATIQPIEAPPASRSPTTAQLKADINSGKTGDKTEVFDPSLSPLGTDDEAAGTPPEPHRIRLARHLEGVGRWTRGAVRAGHAHGRQETMLVPYILGIVLIGAIMLGGVVLGRSW